MTCPTCEPWCAKSEKQLKIRRANMAAQPEVRPFECPACKGIDWATSDVSVVIVPSLWDRLFR